MIPNTVRGEILGDEQDWVRRWEVAVSGTSVMARTSSQIIAAYGFPPN
jgi:hypothetical protein